MNGLESPFYIGVGSGLEYWYELLFRRDIVVLGHTGGENAGPMFTSLFPVFGEP